MLPVQGTHASVIHIHLFNICGCINKMAPSKIMWSFSLSVCVVTSCMCVCMLVCVLLPVLCVCMLVCVMLPAVCMCMLVCVVTSCMCVYVGLYVVTSCMYVYAGMCVDTSCVCVYWSVCCYQLYVSNILLSHILFLFLLVKKKTFFVETVPVFLVLAT
ncbi:hypothetical protein Ahia01_001222700 [Argonauta hians]